MTLTLARDLATRLDSITSRLAALPSASDLETSETHDGDEYVIENVPGAPLMDPIMLCGSAFGLSVQRHRLFETTAIILAPSCRHAAFGVPRYPGTPRKDGTRPLSRVANHMASGIGHEDYAEAMGIDWMRPRGHRPTEELREAIPPAYTEFVGRQLLAALTPKDAA